MRKRKKLSLMPAIALSAIGLMVALPTLSSVSLHAATATRWLETSGLGLTVNEAAVRENKAQQYPARTFRLPGDEGP